MPVDRELLKILVCPESHASLVLDGDTLVSTDEKTRRCYRIEDSIPIMLIDESRILEMEEWQAVMARHRDDGAQPAE